MEEIIKQIKKDLDAGMFNKICSNESTFLSYVQQKLFAFQEADDTHIRLGDVSAWRKFGIEKGYWAYFEKDVKQDFLEKILPEENKPKLGSENQEVYVAYANGYNDCRKRILTNASNEWVNIE
jgi:hypothetical protein